MKEEAELSHMPGTSVNPRPTPSTQLKLDLPHGLRIHSRCLLTYNFWLHTLLFGSLLLCHLLSKIARLSTQDENKKATVAIVTEAWPPLDFPVLYT